MSVGINAAVHAGAVIYKGNEGTCASIPSTAQHHSEQYSRLVTGARLTSKPGKVQLLCASRGRCAAAPAGALLARCVLGGTINRPRKADTYLSAVFPWTSSLGPRF